MTSRPPSEREEWRTALLTFAPAIVVAFALEWALTTFGGWTSRRALATSIAVGIAVALVLQHVLRRRGGRG